MIKTILFDCYGVLYAKGTCNVELVSYIQQHIKPRFSCGILSNATKDEVDSLLPQGVQDLFDVLTLSDEEGYSKPEKHIYLAAVRKHHVLCSEVIFVDDCQDFVLSATALGMQAICYKEFDQFRGEIEKLLR